MKRTLTTRILCLILALCTVFTMASAAFATEVEEPVITEPVVETQPVETEPVETEPVETEPVETEPVETEPVETEPVETEPVETEPEATEPEATEPEATEPEATEPEETEPEETVTDGMDAEVPFGLKGMPEDYVFTEKAMADKVFMNEMNVTEVLGTLVPGEDYVPNEILVDADTLEEAEMMAAAFNGYLKQYMYKMAVISLETVDVESAVIAAADMRVRLPAASPNYIVKLDPMEESDQEDLLESEPVMAAELPHRKDWNEWVVDTMTNPDPYLIDPTATEYNYQWMHDVVDTYAAWGVTTGDPAVKVAVIDTGVNGNHVELAGRVSYINVGCGTTDDNGHGSHVAGIIAASMNNGYGGAGIAPGVSIISVKVLNAKGSGSQSDIINGIYAAVDKGAWIINMSLGGYFASSSYQNAINYAYNSGTTVIVAMGNDSSNIKCYPAALKNVVSVVSTDQTNSRSYFSNWGSWADVSAPGSYIWSLYNGSNYGMSRKSGTSMATPVVAGVAALYMSANGWTSPAKMEKVLKDSCVKGDSNLAKGIVNAANMFSKTKPTVEYFVADTAGNLYSSSTVPCDTRLYLYGTPIEDDTGRIVVTWDGKSPSIKDGQIVNGVEVDEGYLDLAEFAGKTLTVKAIAVNGVGVAGSVKTIKLKVATSSSVSGITIEGPSKLVAGKSATYTATVAPAKANQSVTWKIVENVGMSSAKMSSSGKLTTSSKQEGYVVIRATSKANTSKYRDFKVVVEKIKPVSSMALSMKTATLTLGTNYTGDAKIRLTIAKMVDASGNAINPNVSGVKWSSSNTKVATVDQNGNVVAVAPGSATITCKTLDGSGKSATCKVTVKQRVQAITVTGNASIAPGASATYKATCAPSNASSKSVTWSLSGAPSGAKIDSKGKVTLPKSASTYTTFKVVATAKDGSGVAGKFTVQVMPKCTGLNIKYSDHDSRLITAKSNGYVSSAVLYTMEDDYYYGDDTYMCVSAIGNNVNPVVKWSSSKSSVATVDQYGYVRAVKAGTATITATAQDGSGKTAKITVNVRNPVSTMAIKSSAQRSQGDVGYLAFGKSVSNSVVFADTYGTPTNKNVTWSFNVYEVDSNDRITYNRTSYFKSKGWVSVSSSGKLTTKSAAQKYWYDLSGDLKVEVIATSKDRPDVYATFEYFLIRPASKMYAEIKNGYMSRNNEAVNYIYCDQWRALGGAGFELTATSSNPDIVGVEAVVHDSGYWYGVIFASGSKKGKATVTVKATDGSGKSCKFTINVT